MNLAADVLDHALLLGFDLAAILPVGPPASGERFLAWLDAGYHGEMAYLAARAEERLNPSAWAPAAASMIVVAAGYAGGPGPEAELLSDRSAGRFARYSWTEDYHDVLKQRLFALDEALRARSGRTGFGKACVDTAPLLERDIAARAGLGFIGRNTCLIAPGLGSWTFLGVLLVPEVLAAGGGVSAGRRRAACGCGQCTRCLDRCPTRAFRAPGVLDARRCISYLTIELRGPIPRELRPDMGNWVFGCDLCQEVCPYNRHRKPGRGMLAIDAGRAAAPLGELLRLDEAGYRARFGGTAINRPRRRGLVRNACVAAGNSGDPSLIAELVPLLADAEPLVRGHAAWALGRLGGAAGRRELSTALARENEPWVEAEMRDALDGWPR